MTHRRVNYSKMCWVFFLSCAKHNKTRLTEAATCLLRPLDCIELGRHLSASLTKHFKQNKRYVKNVLYHLKQMLFVGKEKNIFFI